MKLGSRIVSCLIVGFAFTAIGQAQEMEKEKAPPAPAKEGPKIAVILPERIDHTWFWFYYTEESMPVVQAAIEKALVNAGHNVIDISSASAFRDAVGIEQITAADTAVKKAAEMGAVYLIVGRATADNAGESTAYGLNVVRYSARVTAKIVRVSDAKVLAVEEALASTGGQGESAAGREALRQAGELIAGKLVAAGSTLFAP
ncbi:MAG: hypothetical protein V1873_00420 [Verrucomicrobiota bacterium]